MKYELAQHIQFALSRVWAIKNRRAACGLTGGKGGLILWAGRGEDETARLLLVALSVILVWLGGAQQYIGIRPAEGLQPLC